MTARPQHFWAFCANPRYHRIEDAIRECQLDGWNVQREDACVSDHTLIRLGHSVLRNTSRFSGRVRVRGRLRGKCEAWCDLEGDERVFGGCPDIAVVAMWLVDDGVCQQRKRREVWVSWRGGHAVLLEGGGHEAEGDAARQAATEIGEHAFGQCPHDALHDAEVRVLHGDLTNGPSEVGYLWNAIDLKLGDGAEESRGAGEGGIGNGSGEGTCAGDGGGGEILPLAGEVMPPRFLLAKGMEVIDGGDELGDAPAADTREEEVDASGDVVLELGPGVCQLPIFDGVTDGPPILVDRARLTRWRGTPVRGGGKHLRMGAVHDGSRLAEDFEVEWLGVAVPGSEIGGRTHDFDHGISPFGVRVLAWELRERTSVPKGRAGPKVWSGGHQCITLGVFAAPALPCVHSLRLPASPLHLYTREDDPSRATSHA